MCYGLVPESDLIIPFCGALPNSIFACAAKVRFKAKAKVHACSAYLPNAEGGPIRAAHYTMSDPRPCICIKYVATQGRAYVELPHLATALITNQ